MSLSWRQRRVLRAIERALAEQDSQPADRRNVPSAPSQLATVADCVGWSMFWLAILLLTAGLVLVDHSLLQGALLLLGVLPPLVLLVAAASRVDR
jgi:hypothetical protein